MTTPRREYSDELKAAVMAALLSGQSIASIAADYRIPEGTIKSWASRQANGEIVATVATSKRERIGELLLEYLALNLEALKAQARVFADAEWIKGQAASEVAVLHGVVADKGIRLLEALAAAGDETAEQF
jgi:transposase-like protein